MERVSGLNTLEGDSLLQKEESGSIDPKGSCDWTVESPQDTGVLHETPSKSTSLAVLYTYTSHPAEVAPVHPHFEEKYK